jgi:predicted transcriptional regulator|tara:strand:+ start:138 stop:410 length:273 start_codon:yes stop_codon:yes gene_type:complete
MTEKKLEKQHVEEINLIRTKFAENNTEIALATKEIYTLEQRALQIDSYRTQLLEQFQSLQQQESELIAKLKEHYGEGRVDLEKGVFIPES